MTMATWSLSDLITLVWLVLEVWVRCPYPIADEGERLAFRK